MRWVLMLFVILAAVMGGEARAVVVMGRVAVSEWDGWAETVERRAEALRVDSERAFLGAVLEVQNAAGFVDDGPLALWFLGGAAVARSDCGDRLAKYTVTAAAGSAWTVPAAATVQHVRGPDLGRGTKGLLYSLRNGLPTFNRYNGRGDVVAQSNIDGTTTWAASYQADGRRTAEAGTNVERHRANTKEEDPTGLLNEGFRYRDMETGTFISRDPLGLVDGPNVYCYVRQNPWTMWDPEGLWAIADDAIAMGVGAVLGVAAQGVSDVWHGKLSGWEDYAASGVGGALAGEAALYTGGLASGAVYGASANLTRQGLRNLSGKQSGFDCNSLVAETAVCAVGGKLGEVAAPYLSRTVARAMQKESSVVAAGSTTALNAEVKATGDVLESTIAPAAEAGAANKVDDFVPNVPVGRRTKIGETGPDGIQPNGAGRHTPQHANPPYQPVQNTPGSVNGIDYSGHAFDQMRNRGLVPSVVENALRTGTRTPGNTPGTQVVTDSVNSVKIIINSNGRVITVE
jgi:RHS repeat-associated protein